MSARPRLAFAQVTSMDGALAPLRPVQILLTGFGKFDIEQNGTLVDNSSEIIPSRYTAERGEIAVDHPSGRVVKASITGAVLEVTWSRDDPGSKEGTSGAADELENLVRSLRPDVVIATGMRQTPFSVDAMASDWDQAGAKDVRGRRFAEGRMQFSANDETKRYIPTKLPVARIESLWTRARVDYVKSTSAGNYICNDVFYRAVWLAAHGGASSLLAAGFIHVPQSAKAAELEVALDNAIRATLESLDLRPFELPGKKESGGARRSA